MRKTVDNNSQLTGEGAAELCRVGENAYELDLSTGKVALIFGDDKAGTTLERSLANIAIVERTRKETALGVLRRGGGIWKKLEGEI